MDNEPVLAPTKAEVLEQVDMMIKAIENMPSHGLHQPVTHYDLLSILIVVSASLRAKD